MTDAEGRGDEDPKAFAKIVKRVAPVKKQAKKG
jgi:hypothetical protein